MSLLEELNRCNDVPIHDVRSEEFRSFGRVVEGYDVSPLLAYMEEETDIPESGNVYVASVFEMEALPIKDVLKREVYGDMPIQIGYCNGRNSTYNGFEYHKGSELNIAVSDFMLVLGHTYDIRNNSYHVDRATVFFVPKGTMIEMYQTTLHLSPLRVTEEGFRGVVVLPRGTNTPLHSVTEEKASAGGGDCESEQSGYAERDPESVLLLQRNKWVIAHPEREPLIRQGAHPGVMGPNKELYFPEGSADSDESMSKDVK